MDDFHGNWRAPKASRPIITVEATEDAMKQLLAAFGIPSLDFAIGEPGQEEVMMQVSTTGSFPFPCVLPILPAMTCKSGSPGAMPYDAVPCASRIFAWRLRGWGRWKGDG